MSETPPDRGPDHAADTTPGTPMPSYDRGNEPFAGSAEHGLATTAFVLGIMSVLGMPFFGPFAWVLGRRAVREIDTSTVTTYRNRGLGVAGTVLGIIGTVFLVVVAIGLIGVVSFFVLRGRGA